LAISTQTTTHASDQNEIRKRELSRKKRDIKKKLNQ
jgi:hypothetical protein